MSRHGLTAAQHNFAMAPQIGIPRTRFDRSYGHKTTFDAGLLIPFHVDVAYPGDTFSLRMTAFARIATLLFPVMDNLFMDTHFFFVPARLLWTHWEEFNGANIPNTNSSTDYVMPTITSPSGGYATNSIFDYMGLPTLVAGVTTTAMPLRAYNKIYNDWFRDENYNNEVAMDMGDGPDAVTDYALLNRNKRYDYFTSSLPFPQKGPAVTIPLTGNAPVISTGSAPTLYGITSHNTGEFQWSSSVQLGLSGGTYTNGENFSYGVAGTTTTGLEADLSGVAATTINALRLAATTQQMYEKDARGGTRYTEIIRSHFNVISPDQRLQRSEYLGGGSQPISITPVAVTSATGITGASSPTANLAAYGTVALHGHGFTYSFQEHGYVIGLVSVRADYTYWQGAERFWFDSARFDWYWPTFNNIGEQAVLNQEIYAQGSAVDQEVFGYQEYAAHLRFKPSRISGLFRPNATGTLDAWHLAQNFGSLPTLNSSFIAESPPMARIEAVSSEPDFIFDSFIKYMCARPMTMYSVPGITRL